MTGFADRLRWLRQLGLIDSAGELTARGEAFAEERSHPTGSELDDVLLDHPAPYPDSELY